MFISKKSIKSPTLSNINTLPFIAFAIALVISISIWFLLINERKRDIHLATRITTEQTAARLESWIDIRVNALQMLKDVVPPNFNGSASRFNSEASLLIKEFQGYQAINWINSDLIITSVNPLKGNEKALQKDLHHHPFQGVRDALSEAFSNNKISRTTLIGLLQGGKGFALYIPIEINEEIRGYINCVFKTEYLIESCLKNSDIYNQYEFAISENGQIFYSTPTYNPENTTNSVSFTSDFLVVDKGWSITLSPVNTIWSLGYHYSYNIFLLVGILFSFILFFLIRVNIKNQIELRKNELKYRTLFEETQDVIFYTTTDGKLLTYNPAIKTLFGYSDEELRAMNTETLYDNFEDRRTFVNDVLKQKTVINREIKYRHKNGKLLSCLVTASLRENIFPNKTVLQGIIHDITELREGEKEKHGLETIIRTVFETAEDYISILDKDRKYLLVNPMAAKSLNSSPSDIIGKKLEELFPDSEQTKKSMESDLKVLEGEIVNEIYNAGDEENPVYLSTIKVPLYDNYGDVYGLCSIARDITQQKEIEEKLRLNEDRLELVLKNANIGLYDFDIVNDYNFVSDQWAEMLGYKREEIGKSYSDWKQLVHPDDFPEVESNLIRHYENILESYESKFRMKTKSGDWKVILTQGRVVNRDKDGKPLRLVGTHIDITELQKAEEEREKHLNFLINLGKIDDVISRSSNMDTLLDEVLNTSLEIFETDRIWLIHPCDPEVKYLKIVHEKTSREYPGTMESGIPVINNEEYSTFLKYSLENTVPVCYDPDSVVKLPSDLEKIFHVQSMLAKSLHPKIGEPWLFGMHHCRSTREWLPEEIRLFNEIGFRITDTLTTMITMQNLRDSEEKFRTIAENTPGIIFMYDIDSNGTRSPLYSGPGLEDLVGPETAKEVSNDIAKFFSIVPEEDYKKITDIAEQSDDSVLDTTYRVLTDENTYKWVRSISRSKPLDNGGNRVQGMLIDINDQIKAEEALQESQEMLQVFMDSATDIFTIWSRRLRLLQVNSRGLKDLHNRGFTSPVDMSMTEFRSALKMNNFRRYRNVLRSGIPDVIEEISHNENGEKTYFQNRVFKVGNGIGIISSDVTEKNLIEEERKKIEERYKEAQRMESLSILAGGIAHDFNNLLAGIMGNADLALLDMSPVSPAYDSIQQIQKSSERAAELTKQMLAYSGKGKFIIQSFDLSELVREMTNLVKSSISKKTRLSFNLSKQMKPIEGDVTQIRQLIMNLIINASDALENEEGVVAVSTSYEYCTSDDFTNLFLGEDLPEGNYVKLEVSDTGCGMDEETKGRIFDPFFTTKFTGRGLGLAAALGIIRGHKGTLHVRSKEKEGTTFTIYFPANTDDNLTEIIDDKKLPDIKGSGTILVVDDEEQVRNIAIRMLSRFGFDTLVASDGIEAIATVKQLPNGIDGILMDLSMPRMGGDQAVDKIREINPDIPIVISSGFSEDDISEKFKGRKIIGFIQKPFRTKDIIEHFLNK